MKRCILCKKELKKKIYEMPNMPNRVQHMARQDSLSTDDSIDLTLYQCDGCGLVQFDCSAVDYYKDVIRASKVSDELRRLRKKQYEYLIQKYNLTGKSIWEVGCGAGEFLNILKEYPVHLFGIENNSELVEQARQENLDVMQGFPDSEFIDSRGPFDCFLSFNFLEHQPDPCGMISCIYNNLKENGIGLITVPSFEYFIEMASYYEFMRDHIAYYTESALSLLFELNGFETLEISRFNGDTTQVIVKKRATIQLPDFDNQKNNIEIAINKYIKENDIETVVVWGASHQGLTMLATLSIDKQVKYIVDSASFKWDCYAPVSHILIRDPSQLAGDHIDLIIIMAPAFSDEITEQINKNYPHVKHILAVKNDEVMIKK